MPQLDPSTFVSQLFWLAVSFGVLYFVLSQIALPRIAATLEMRRKRIADDLDKAQSLKARADADAAAYEAKLAAARVKAQTLAKQTQDRLAAETEKGRKALAADLAKRFAEEETRIAASRNAAMANVEAVAAEVATAIVAELTGLKTNGRDAKKAVAASLTKTAETV